MTPGIHDLTFREYLADPCPAPSLTAGVGHVLVERSARHAWHRYNEERAYRRDAALGSVFHALFLGAGSEYAVLDVDDFRSKAAREARDEAILAGKTPIKAADFELAERMLEACCEQLERHEVGNPTNRPGTAESTLIWREGEVWCRARPDWMPEDLDVEPYIYNIKTSTCAHRDVWIRRAYEAGYDLSAAHYVRGIGELIGYEVTDLFVVVETEPPHGVSVIQLDSEAMALAEKKRAGAVRLWRGCLARSEWPGYPRHVWAAGAPGYKAAQIEERDALGMYGEVA